VCVAGLAIASRVELRTHRSKKEAQGKSSERRRRKKRKKKRRKS
jgi:hypothetical protein